MKLSHLNKTFLFIAILGLCAVFFNAIATEFHRHSTRVLFIGNSLTSANNLPGMVADIAKSHGHPILYEAHMPNGTSFAQHNSSAALVELIKEQPWDVVVLQEQSQYPSFPDWQLKHDVLPYAARLVEKVRAHSPNARIVFYLSMAHKDGDVYNKKIFPEVADYTRMQNRISATYIQMAKENKGQVAPVGEVWRAVRSLRPDINLYADDRHPTPAGTYLAACTFFSTLFQEPCSGSPAPAELDKETVASLQEISDRIVLDKQAHWDWSK